MALWQQVYVGTPMYSYMLLGFQNANIAQFPT